MTPEEQSRRNFSAWWGMHGVCVYPLHVTTSRAWYRRESYIEAVIAGLVKDKVLLPASADNHGVDVEAGYREDVPLCSAQIVVHSWFIEMDFDFHNPTRDLAGAIGHLGELIVNKITGTTTDPFEVARLLKERGALV